MLRTEEERKKKKRRKMGYRKVNILEGQCGRDIGQPKVRPPETMPWLGVRGGIEGLTTGEV
jgi:hypothetical protein